MADVLTVNDVRPGQQVKLLTSGWYRGADMYRDLCAKRGAQVTIVQNDGMLVNTTGGFVCNPKARMRLIGDTRPPLPMPNLVPVGGDPEMFVKAGSRLIPAWEFLPRQSELGGKRGAFWDGFQAEVTFHPSGCIAFTADNLRASIKKVWDAAKVYNPKARLDFSSVVTIPRAMMAAVTDEQADLGCAPSMNVYGEEPLRVAYPRTLSLRFAGAHIHVSTLHVNVEMKVRMMDEVFGICSVAMLAGLDDARRRRYYGRAGEYRLPEYGIEYRVPPAVVASHPVLWNLSCDLVRYASLLVGFDTFWGVPSEEIRRIINEDDVEAARRILQNNMDTLDAMLSHLYASARLRRSTNGMQSHSNAKRLILEGAANCLTGLDNPVKAWQLDGGWREHSESDNCSVNAAVLT